jgi:DNA-binding NtrC family response regulator
MTGEERERTALVVDPDPETRAVVEDVLRPERYEVLAKADGHRVTALVGEHEVDLLVAEIEVVGEGELKALRALDNPPEILMVGERAKASEVAEAIKRGADHFIGKPIDREALLEIARRAAAKRRITEENRALRQLASRRADAANIVSESPAMRTVLDRVGRVAKANASVLIIGGTGVGKGLVARAIHGLSRRSDEPFLPINCGALQEQLLESELFGHAKGAFTGASEAKLGLFEVASGGTLFLDEIGEMSGAMQTRLLQVLDTGLLRQVGGTKLKRIDTRIIAATNKNLEKEVRAGRFREDLFFRLNVVCIEVPPLRERKEDIPGLVDLFRKKFAPADGEPKRVARRTLQLLMEYHWPGNVRELSNFVESMSILAPGPVILPEDLPPSLQPISYFESRAIEVPLPLSEMERLHILRALDYMDGKKAPTARLLGIDVKTLSNKLKAYKLES